MLSFGSTRTGSTISWSPSTSSSSSASASWPDARSRPASTSSSPGRSLPAWVTGLAFISANLGAVEIIGMSANGAQFGLPTRALLLDRRRAGDAVPRRRDDAVLLRLQGPIGPGVHEPTVRSDGPPRQRDQLRARAAAHRGHQPLPARQDRRGAPGLAALDLADRRGGRGADLHRAGRALRRDLQRGAAVLRDRGGADAAHPGRAVQGRRLERAHRRRSASSPTRSCGSTPGRAPT